MSLKDFISKRKKEIKGKTSQSDIDKMQAIVYNTQHYVDCKSCTWFKDSFCEIQDAIIPDEIVPLGCSKGEPDIPF